MKFAVCAEHRISCEEYWQGSSLTREKAVRLAKKIVKQAAGYRVFVEWSKDDGRHGYLNPDGRIVGVGQLEYWEQKDKEEIIS